MEQVVDGGLEFEAEILLFETGSEFAAERVGALTRNHAHGRDEALSGAQCADHEIARLGQFLLKCTKALAPFEKNKKDGHETKDQACQRREEYGCRLPVHNERRNREASAAHGKQTSRTPLKIGLMNERLQLWTDFEFSKPAVDPGNGAELLVFAQVDNLFARRLALSRKRGVERGLHLLGLLSGAGAACE